MLHTPEQYRAKAKECEAMADRALDPEASQQFRRLAKQWLVLAERADTATELDAQRRGGEKAIGS